MAGDNVPLRAAGPAVLNSVPPVAPGSRWRTGVHACLLLIVFALGVELTARVDDRLRSSIPFFTTPDRVADLVVQDEFGTRGKPLGRYKLWKLNSFGFRGPEISQLPAAGCTRVMTLGASETFGLWESDGFEYPAQLGTALADAGCYEVVNASIFGLTVPDIDQTWNKWGSQFAPHVVTIYPTPSFYLAPGQPGASRPRTTPFPRPAWWHPRAWERAKDVIEYPEFIQRRRVESAVQQVDASRDPSWFYRSVPQDRLARYETDLDQLVRDVKRTGARVIVMTHATGFDDPPAPDQMGALVGWRSVLSKPTTDVLLEFETATRDATHRVAAANGVEVLDLAAQLDGDGTVFAADLLHFTNEGSRRVANLLRDLILTAPHRRTPH